MAILRQLCVVAERREISENIVPSLTQVGCHHFPDSVMVVAFSWKVLKI
jgi:hypothetical protein